MSCPVHDSWRLEKDCTCSPERIWAREKMLQEALVKIATPKVFQKDSDEV
jgi:hypothetical protein